MMSFQDYRAFSKYRREESITLFVETLTGTKFEMSVLPHDTIKSVKVKIQRIGGIPISQQHLIYNLQELDDASLLADYSVKSGSTLKLVLSMRGGPISTVRRVLPLDDAALRELMESNREELLDDLPPGCKMAVLVFRDGDQLNMFRVLENVDGSYSPLSDSSMLNLFEDEGMLKTDEFTKRFDENTVTMEKMYDLKTKLAELAIQRKTHKLRPVETEDDNEDRAPVASTSAESAREKGTSKSKLPPIPSLESRLEDENVCESASLVRKTRTTEFLEPPGTTRETEFLERPAKTRTTEFSRVPVLPEIASRATPSPRLAVGDAVECVGAAFERERPRTSPDDDRLTGERVCQILSDASRLSRARRCTALPLHRFPRVPPMANSSLDSDQEKDKISAVSCVVSVFSRPRSGLERETPSSENMASFSTTCKYSTRRSKESSASRFKVSSPKMSDVLNETDDTDSNYPSSEVANDRSRRDSLRFLSRASRSKESPPESSKPTSKTLASLNTRSRMLSRDGDIGRNRSNFHIQLSRNSSSSELLRYPDDSSFTLIDEERLRQAADGGYGKVPTVKGSQTSLYDTRVKKKKKEAKARCTVCRKRLTIISTYTCRCGNIFCSIHRYSEAHDCDYDYKEEGRRILEQNNPLIRAPKLPKI
ncbi:AN1-type zinc finger protein 4 [Nilaparvata lugens]|uniref:AN1-type zinc finger protein 4 n=1 Tax=Nilaparvata lugens TaxID=108931 RepID=UPI00193E2110|nr:AN1-type zinc finger protein 4 [Nilaparvata lugens]XP_039275468.1 AN1-type zinc finger protein 4 [Nilaparvata lugens]